MKDDREQDGGLKARALSFREKAPAFMLIGAVVFVFGMVAYRQGTGFLDDVQEENIRRRAAILLVQGQPTEDGLQLVHHLPPGGEWDADPWGVFVYRVKYECDGKEWVWRVDLEAWEVEEMEPVQR